MVSGWHVRAVVPGFSRSQRFATRVVLGSLICSLGLFPHSSGATTRSFPGAAPCNTTLQACINGSSTGDTINIATGTYSLPEIVVNKSMTLKGAAAGLVNLQPDGAHRVLSTGQNLAGGVTLSHLTIRNGACAGAQTGGGIFADTGTPLNLDTMEVKNNTCANNSGGGIFVSADATLDNVDVLNNTAPNGAGAGMRATGNVTVHAGHFESNVSFNPGGAMRVTGTLTLTDVQVLTNSNTAAGTNGGGIRADGGLTMTRGVVQGNTSANLGGGVFATSATISGATIQSNSATKGGGIYATGTLDVTDTLFSDNSATAGNGGAIYAAGAATTTTLTGSSTSSKTVLNSNTASASGGGLFAVGDVLLVGESSFNGNKANGGNGGAIDANNFEDSGNVTLKKVFESNTASGNGGAINAAGTVHLVGTPVFTNNTAGGGTSGDGGAVRAGGDVFLSLGSSSGNKARNGGAVYGLGSVFFNVHDTGPNSIAAANIALADGGCAYAGVDVTYNSADARNCNATGRGGAAFALGKVSLTANGVGVFSANVSGGDGGLAYAAQIVVENAPTVSFNSAGGSGGAVLSTGTMSINNAVLANNTAGAFGGAASAGGALTVAGSEFTANSAASGGGAIRGSATIDVASSTFSGNHATGANSDGGAIRGTGSLTTIADSVFDGNTSVRRGGAASANGAAIQRSTFSNNSGSSAGALTLLGDSYVRASSFIANQSPQAGAISAQLADTTHVLQVQESLFADNTATNQVDVATDLRVFDLDLVLLNNTFARPGATNDSVDIFRCVVTAVDNVFSGYLHSLNISDTMNTTVNEDYNDFFNSPLAASVISGGHSITSDPQFRDPASGNFRPKVTSPLLDAGDNSALPVDLTADLDGLPRREDVASAPDTGIGPPPIVDIGAYEFHDAIFANGFELSM